MRSKDQQKGLPALTFPGAACCWEADGAHPGLCAGAGSLPAPGSHRVGLSHREWVQPEMSETRKKEDVGSLLQMPPDSFPVGGPALAGQGKVSVSLFFRLQPPHVLGIEPEPLGKEGGRAAALTTKQPSRAWVAFLTLCLWGC